MDDSQQPIPSDGLMKVNCENNTNSQNINYLEHNENTLLNRNKKKKKKKNMREKFTKFKNSFENHNVLVSILSIFFGIAAWVGVNSIFVQLPLIVKNAPEGWSLPSYIVVIVQSGIIGPLIYTLLHKIYPNKIRDAYMIYMVLIIGAVSALLTSFLYDKTIHINDKEYSVPLFVLVFFLGLNACTSSVLFMPYMGRFHAFYLIMYLFGEGISGLLLSIIALIQGNGGNAKCTEGNTTNDTSHENNTPSPLFTTSDFFIFVFSLMLCCSIAFTLLDNLNICKKEYAAVKINHGNHYEYENTDILEGNVDGSKSNENFNNSTKIKDKITPKQYKLLLFLLGIICIFGNGIIPSIQSYSCLPYGNNIYHLTVVLTYIANPLSCFFAIFLQIKSIKLILILSGMVSFLASYCLVTAALSPEPPLFGTLSGGIINVITWTIFAGLISYIKLSITAIMRLQAGKSLVWTGAVGQTGSVVGSFIGFCLINYTKIFVSSEPC